MHKGLKISLIVGACVAAAGTVVAGIIMLRGIAAAAHIAVEEEAMFDEG